MSRVSPEDFIQLVYDEVNKAIRTIPQLVFQGQINLGAVEVKDADADRRLKVKHDGTDNAVVVTANALPLPAGAATEAKQDALLAKNFATEATLAAVLAKLIADPATAPRQDAIIALLTPGTPEHKNGTAGTSPGEITFSGLTKYVVVQSLGSADKLEVSFDGGTTYMRVIGKGQVALPCRVTRLHVRSTDGSVPYNILASV